MGARPRAAATAPCRCRGSCSYVVLRAPALDDAALGCGGNRRTAWRATSARSAGPRPRCSPSPSCFCAAADAARGPDRAQHARLPPGPAARHADPRVRRRRRQRAATPERMRDWAAETTAAFALDELASAHFPTRPPSAGCSTRPSAGWPEARAPGKCSATQLRAYREDGFAVVPGCWTGRSRPVRHEAQQLYPRDLLARSREGRHDGTGRARHPPASDLMARLVRLPDLLEHRRTGARRRRVRHQSKVNAKRAQPGSMWPWHQDFTSGTRGRHARAAGDQRHPLPRRRVPQNGPLLLVPTRTGSARSGRATRPGRRRWRLGIEPGRRSRLRAESGPSWSRWSPARRACGHRDGRERALFDPRVVHSSGANTSARDRQLLMITYNSVATGSPPSAGRGRSSSPRQTPPRSQRLPARSDRTGANPLNCANAVRPVFA